MRLKKLEIQGFKSFVDKTEITFEDGITAVVGPNGSGKSNISDALRWVLGEQSAKTLRGSKMGDVIFSGTQKRNPVGFCKVELTFDNEDKWLNIDFGEVCIARKYYKSGESIYYINNKECRLKDVLELFRDTGVGKEGYSIIGQGQVTNILSSNASERRMVFEAATGILKCKSRKSDAQSRLFKTGENIDRLNDLLEEIKGNLMNLEEQSAQAKEYLQFREQLEKYEIARYIYKGEAAQKKHEKLTKELADIGEIVEKAQGDIESLKVQKEDLTNEIAQVTSQIESLKAKHVSLREEILKSGSKTEVIFERIKGLNENISGLAQQNSELDNEIVEFNSQISIEQTRLQELGKSLSDVSDEYDRKLKEHEELKKNLEDKSSVLEDLKQKKILFLNSVSEVKVNSSKYNTMLETICARLDDIEKLSLTVKDKISQIEGEKQSVTNTKRELDSNKEKLENKKNELLSLRDDIEAKRAGILERRHKYDVDKGSAVSKLNLLKNMQKEYDGYNFAVKNLLKLAQKDSSIGGKIRGTVSDVIDVDKAYISAIETAIGGALQNIVTDTEEDAKALIEILKRNNLGRATFLPVSSVRPAYLNREELASIKGMDGVIGCAADLVKRDEYYDPIVQKLLGRTVVAENMDCAIKIMRKNSFRFQTVTFDGDIIHAGGAMSGGSKSKKGVGLLSRNDEIASLQKYLDKLERDTVSDFDELAALDGKIQAVNTAFAENKQLMKQAYDGLDNVQNELSILDTQIDNETEKLVELNEEKEQLLDNKTDIEDKLSLVSVDSNINAMSVDEEEINVLSKQVYELRNDNEKSYLEISEIMSKRSGLEKDVHSCKRDMERLMGDVQVKRRQIEKNEKSAEEMQSEVSRLQKSVEDNVHQSKETSVMEEQLKVAIDDGEKNLYVLQTKLRENETAVETCRDVINENTDRKYKIDVDLSKLAMETEMMTNDMFERYDVTYEQACEKKPDITLGMYKKEIDELKDKIKEMGNVNLNSIEEYAYTRSRYDQITEQITDLSDSKRDLEELIEMLQKEMTVQFKEQFELINLNFERIFKSLFGGGKAQLVLNKNESVLESDIEIIAQPPGKKLQTISLMSGGEKSLTAIAILFAMLELKPTPFCVLDEIESALDEANVHSFAMYLKNYSNKTQFLVITHRRGVMELSDAIYGVAMQEKGVSKVVSIKMEDKKEKAYGIV